MSGSLASATAAHRPDLDGLRAIAVAMVVAFHADFPGFEFGFWGVDVFFVLSGYLITRNIWRDLDARSFSFAEFWARRIRRLVPAATVVILATLLLAFTIGSPLDWRSVGREALLGVTYTTNLFLAFANRSYFNEGMLFQPFLHLWSLAVEEQFYLIWPFLLVAVQRRGFKKPQVIIATFGLPSLLLAMAISRQAPHLAFYLPPTRLWEFACGAFIALAPPARHLNPLARSGLVVVAFCLFGVGAVLLTPFTSLPGWLTVLPVAATTLLVWCGDGPHALSLFLTSRPLQTIGRLSYGIYLWHWPVFRYFLVSSALTHSHWHSAIAIAATVGLAALTYSLVENPVRFASSLRAPRRNFLLAGASVVAIATAGVGLRLGHGRLPTELRNLETSSRDAVALSGCDGDEGCLLRLGTRELILILGDSHAMHWLPAIVATANDADATVVYAGLSACPAFDVPTSNRRLGQEHFVSCSTWHGRLPRIVEQYRPQVIIAAQSEGTPARVMHPLDDLSERLERWSEATARFADLAQRVGAVPVVFLDTPWLAQAPHRCLSRRWAPMSCQELNTMQADQIAVRHVTTEAAAARSIALFDAAAVACPGWFTSGCRVSDGLDLRFRDQHHLTATYSESLAAELAEALPQLAR